MNWLNSVSTILRDNQDGCWDYKCNYEHDKHDGYCAVYVCRGNSCPGLGCNAYFN